MLYLLNSPVLSSYGQWSFEGALSIDDVRDRFADGFVSAIGHKDTALFVSDVLGVNCEFKRQAIFMLPGDEAVVFYIKGRPKEGVILTLDELNALPYEFALLKRLA